MLQLQLDALEGGGGTDGRLSDATVSGSSRAVISDRMPGSDSDSRANIGFPISLCPADPLLDIATMPC